MHTASLSPDAFESVLARLPPDLDVDALALATRAIERARKIVDGKALLRLALARGPGGLSLNQTAAWATMAGLPPLSDPSLKYRLDKAVPFLKALMERQLASQARSTTLHWPGRVLRLVDGTSIEQPASTGTDWRVHAGFDLGSGSFSHLELTDGRGAESIERGAPVAGEVRIGDRNYANAGPLHRLCQQAGHVDFIVRVRWKGFALTRPDGTPFDLVGHLATLSQDAGPQDAGPQDVLVHARVSGTERLPMRLIIQRRPPAHAESTRQHLRRNASRKQKRLDPRSLVAAEFLIVATSLPALGYPADEVLTAYRLRWQIELAFKRLKSLLHIGQVPTRTAAASQSWLYAHLILALLCDGLSQEVLASSPSGRC